MRALLLVALLGCHVVPSNLTVDSGDLKSMQSRTVQIFAYCEKGDSSGSGVIIGEHDGGTIIVTAQHVVGDCLVSYHGGMLIPLKVDKDRDLAILWSSVKHGVETSLVDIPLGTDVWAWGYPSTRSSGGATRLTATRGVLASKPRKHLWRVTSQAWFGSSGGPVFDRFSNLTGIMVSVWASPFRLPVDGEYFMVPASDVSVLLESL